MSELFDLEEVAREFGVDLTDDWRHVEFIQPPDQPDNDDPEETT